MFIPRVVPYYGCGCLADVGKVAVIFLCKFPIQAFHGDTKKLVAFVQDNRRLCLMKGDLCPRGDTAAVGYPRPG